jgi:hypothetical protein
MYCTAQYGEIPPICSPQETVPKRFSKTSTEKVLPSTSATAVTVKGVTAPSLEPWGMCEGEGTKVGKGGGEGGCVRKGEGTGTGV